jgi:hypothetical protein
MRIQDRHLFDNARSCVPPLCISYQCPLCRYGHPFYLTLRIHDSISNLSDEFYISSDISALSRPPCSLIALTPILTKANAGIVPRVVHIFSFE